MSCTRGRNSIGAAITRDLHSQPFSQRGPRRCGTCTKTADQLDLQALHRVRERLVRQRTGIINQIRAFLLERGIEVRQGLRFLRTELPGILAERSDAHDAHYRGRGGRLAPA